MKFQLVLQWPASTIKDYDGMVWVEDALIKGIGDIAEIDGHDAGSGEVNIFLLTDDPILAFNEVKRILGSKDFMIGLKAAFREQDQENYKPIWPPNAPLFQ